MEALHLTLTLQAAERILLLHEAAKRNGALVSISEIISLLPESTSEHDLAAAFETSSPLSSRLELRSGYVMEKEDDRLRESAIANELERRGRALVAMGYAERLTSLIQTSSTPLITVSGSTSYKSASRFDDLDFFCVTQTRNLWVQLTRFLILARAFGLTNRRSPQMCFSCAMDEDYAMKTFGTIQDPLFARDVLQAVVLTGEGLYGRLLETADWISDIYPSLYCTRRAQTKVGKMPSSRPRFGSVFLNRLLFIIVGSYVRAKASIRNRRLAKQLRNGEQFSILTGAGHLIYESRRYTQLRQSYIAANNRQRTRSEMSTNETQG